VVQWLPRQTSLAFPRLLAAALTQAAEWGVLRRHLKLASVRLQESRLQVHRIVSLMWDAARGEARNRWFPQGQIMGRLQEECARCARFGTPFTVALGEVSRTGAAALGEDVTLGRQAVERITEAKRRCDVLGQYGPHGFLLLLVNTTTPGAEQCCRRIRQALAADVLQGQGSIDTVFGLANCPGEGDDPKTLLSRAERALELGRI
jgi:GGDEF domain-containing protein